MHPHHLLHTLYDIANTYFEYFGFVFLVTLLLISAFWGFLTALDVLLLGIRKLWQRLRSGSHNGYTDYQAEVYRLRMDVALAQLAIANERLAAYEQAEPSSACWEESIKTPHSSVGDVIAEDFLTRWDPPTSFTSEERQQRAEDIRAFCETETFPQLLYMLADDYGAFAHRYIPAPESGESSTSTADTK